ncbi:hypothetical protein [Tuwongella immobilis]|uniref:Uncharacterized protein n=1 Tax=Tuwongella immobilis TaxID=692036 RepID=A0A6C2YPQ4_9BACT|nr:hypothetical protein [Tuwongella immobilis]VIP03291.1 unnamed protein product [Tuwongella immobilis]VTS03953.1 unnamed protein product [Tuwongella immobilis]
MLNELALMGMLMLAPAQASELTLQNVRSTIGEFGPARGKAPLKPGDTYFLSFDIAGVAVDATGKVSYSMGMEVASEKGTKIFEQKPADNSDYLPLGGTVLPARAYVAIPLEQEPGGYVLKLTITDRVSKVSKTLEERFTVKPREFGIVSLFTTYDPKAEVPAPLSGQVGQRIWLHFAVVEFARSGTDKQPNLEVTMEAMDTEGNMVSKPTVLTVNKGIDEKDTGVPMRFMLPFNREGKYRVRLKAVDKLTNKSDVVELPIVVTPVN